MWQADIYYYIPEDSTIENSPKIGKHHFVKYSVLTTLLTELVPQSIDAIRHLFSMDGSIVSITITELY